ncbi:MAG: hypothetical protein RL397_972 [Pseudomonadota bacterium]|jgi:hypothetical protein
MTASAMGVLSSYALEVLELAPLWRYRDRPSMGLEDLHALPAPHQWWSVSATPLADGLREAVGQAARLAMGPLEMPSLEIAWRVAALPQPASVSEQQGPDAPGVAQDAWQAWLVAQMQGQGQGQGQVPIPGVVLLWGAGFAGPLAVPHGEAQIQCVGLPAAAAAQGAEARRQIWAALLGLREALR